MRDFSEFEKNIIIKIIEKEEHLLEEVIVETICNENNPIAYLWDIKEETCRLYGVMDEEKDDFIDQTKDVIFFNYLVEYLTKNGLIIFDKRKSLLGYSINIKGSTTFCTHEIEYLGFNFSPDKDFFEYDNQRFEEHLIFPELFKSIYTNCSGLMFVSQELKEIAKNDFKTKEQLYTEKSLHIAECSLEEARKSILTTEKSLEASIKSQEISEKSLQLAQDNNNIAQQSLETSRNSLFWAYIIGIGSFLVSAFSFYYNSNNRYNDNVLNKMDSIILENQELRKELNSKFDTLFISPFKMGEDQ